MGSNQPGQIHDIEREFRLGRLQNRGGSRIAISWLLTVLIYAGLIGVLFFSVNFIVVDQSGFSGLVQVQLGTPDGLQSGIPPAGQAAENPEPSQAEPSPEESPAEASPSPVETASPDVVMASPSPKASASPKASPSPKASTKPSPKPSVKPTPKTSTRPVTSSQPSPSTNSIPRASPLSPPTIPTLAKGVETGNSYETTVAQGSGHVTQAFYSPIWLYMPLPSKLPLYMADRIPDQVDQRTGKVFLSSQDRLTRFKEVYEQRGDGWYLIGPSSAVDYDSRPPIWVMLQDAGYNLDRAEYKTIRHLSPMTLKFAVTAGASGRGVTLTSVRIQTASGSDEIDRAVLYGFQRSSFTNDTSTPVDGTFVYRFNN